MSRHFTTSFLAFLLFVAGWYFVQARLGVANESPTLATVTDPSSLSVFMRKKLEASRLIVEGLAREDFDLTKRGANTLVEMSQAALWKSRANPVYTQDTADFVRSAKRLVDRSQAKDVDGAAAAYTKIILQCVECHRHVRGKRVVSLPNAVPQLTRTDRPRTSRP